ncbi:MAG: PASTA domain-containing protein [Marinilabilia sp.]
MLDFKTIFNKTIAKHLGIIVLSGIFIIFLIFFGLDLYTRHGQAFEVPDFTGLTEEQFGDIMEEHELRYSIIDSVYVEDEPPGTVLEQTPQPGSLVKKNRNIFFTINSWEPEKVQMPDVTDYSIRNARVMLESFGLEVGKLAYVPSEYTNLVLGQHYKGKAIEPGTSLERGSTIDLIVGQGLSNQRTAVPHLVGLKLEEAKEISQNVSLNIGAEIHDTTIVSKEDTAEAFVWKQSPEGSRDNQLQLGSSIDIWLTTDSALLEVDSAGISSPLDTIMQENIIINEDRKEEDFEEIENQQDNQEDREDPGYFEDEDEDEQDDDEEFF